MEEDLTSFTYLAAVLLLVLNLAQWLRQRSKAKVFAHQKYVLIRDIVSLRREAEKLNTPSTFAKCAKYQRMANTKEKELEKLQAATSQPMDVVDRVLVAVKVVACTALAVVCWGRPVAHVLPEQVWPLHRLLDFSYSRLAMLTRQAGAGGVGAVYMLPWLLLCDRVSKLVARTALPLPRTPAIEGAVETAAQGGGSGAGR